MWYVGELRVNVNCLLSFFVEILHAASTFANFFFKFDFSFNEKVLTLMFNTLVTLLEGTVSLASLLGAE